MGVIAYDRGEMTPYIPPETLKPDAIDPQETPEVPDGDGEAKETTVQVEVEVEVGPVDEKKVVKMGAPVPVSEITPTEAVPVEAPVEVEVDNTENVTNVAVGVDKNILSFEDDEEKPVPIPVPVESPPAPTEPIKPPRPPHPVLHRLPHQIFFIQKPLAEQSSFIETLRFLSVEERTANMWVMLQMQLTYYNSYNEVRYYVTM